MTPRAARAYTGLRKLAALLHLSHSYAEAYLATKEAPSRPCSRVPQPHALARRAQSAEPATPEGASRAGSLTRPRPPMAQEPLSRERRLRRRADFESLRENGTSRAHPCIIMRVAPNELPYPRFGFIIGKRVSKSAVSRNRVRRRLREAVRRAPVHPGWDVLLIARPAALDASYTTLRAALMELGSRCGVIGAARTEEEARRE